MAEPSSINGHIRSVYTIRRGATQELIGPSCEITPQSSNIPTRGENCAAQNAQNVPPRKNVASIAARRVCTLTFHGIRSHEKIALLSVWTHHNRTTRMTMMKRRRRRVDGCRDQRLPLTHEESSGLQMFMGFVFAPLLGLISSLCFWWRWIFNAESRSFTSWCRRPRRHHDSGSAGTIPRLRHPAGRRRFPPEDVNTLQVVFRQQDGGFSFTFLFQGLKRISREGWIF